MIVLFGAPVLGLPKSIYYLVKKVEFKMATISKEGQKTKSAN